MFSQSIHRVSKIKFLHFGLTKHRRRSSSFEFEKMKNWLVIGIAGTTCSGKTTLAKKLHENFENSVLLNQDQYFLPEDDPRHTEVPELNHHNWDILTSLDMERMHSDILKILCGNGSTNCGDGIVKRILILDGFLLFNYRPISELCDFKIFLDISRDECERRRKTRVYDPPDVPGYFELVVWPEYIKHKSEIEKDKKLFDEIIFLSGSENRDEIFRSLFEKISKKL